MSWVERLACRLFGHRWKLLAWSERYPGKLQVCSRCGEALRTIPKPRYY